MTSWSLQPGQAVTQEPPDPVTCGTWWQPPALGRWFLQVEPVSRTHRHHAGRISTGLLSQRELCRARRHHAADLAANRRTPLVPVSNAGRGAARWRDVETTAPALIWACASSAASLAQLPNPLAFLGALSSLV
jgi:hypothetical protein